MTQVITAGKNKRVAYIKETAYGVTPANPSLQAIEFEKASFNLKRDNIEDKSRNPAGITTGFRSGNYEVGGSLDVVATPDSHDKFLTAAIRSAGFSSGVATNGTVEDSFTFEEEYSNVAGVTEYKVTRGVVVDSAKITIAGNDNVGISFGLKGASTSALTSTSVDADGYTPYVKGDKLFHEGGTFKVKGSIYGWLKGASIEIGTAYQMLHTLGSSAVAAATAGKLTIKGSLDAYFDSVTAYNDFIGNVEQSLEFTIVNQGGHGYKIKLPALKFSGVTIKDDSDDSVEQTISFEAYADASNKIIEITKI